MFNWIPTMFESRGKRTTWVARTGALPPVDGMLTVRVAESVMEDMSRTIGQHPAEQGGFLAGSRCTNTVTRYHFDRTGTRSATSYTPDTAAINGVIKDVWGPLGVELQGNGHSHPKGSIRPSWADVAYAKDILRAIPALPHFILFILQTRPDTGSVSVYAYTVDRSEGSDALKPAHIEVLADEMLIVDMPQPAISIRPERSYGHSWGTFDRVQSAYDLRRLATSRVVVVGIGGGSGFVEDLARAGVGEFVLIDPDVVSPTNVGTQQAYLDDVGEPKVCALAERIRCINPDAVVEGYSLELDEFADEELERLATESLHEVSPARTLLVAMTDSFPAQARMNLLSLTLGLPLLAAQMYAEGRGAEVTFTYPGVTAACHRCILDSRYRAYLEHGYQNSVTSHGTPIMSCSRLNATAGLVALALLHHGSDHPRWGRLLGSLHTTNLAQIRMDPDLMSMLGISVFNRVLNAADARRVKFDETLWLPQQPLDPEPCPDCGSTGDLRDAIGRFDDTRQWRTGDL